MRRLARFMPLTRPPATPHAVRSPGLRHPDRASRRTSRVGPGEDHLDVVGGEPGEIAGPPVPRLEHQHASHRARPARCAERRPLRGRAPLRSRRARAGDRRRDPRCPGRRAASVPSPLRVREHVEVRERQRLDEASVASKSASVSPGKPDDDVGAEAERPEWRRPAARPARGTSRVCTAARIRRSTDRSRSAAAGAGAARGRRASSGRPITASVKYAGSTDDSRSQRSPGTSARRRSSAARLVRGVRSAP